LYSPKGNLDIRYLQSSTILILDSLSDNTVKVMICFSISRFKRFFQ
jgi:hypothetical protein